jgi:hypothetical protein
MYLAGTWHLPLIYPADAHSPSAYSVAGGGTSHFWRDSLP